MPHVIACTTCSKQLRLPETLIGQLVCCPACQTEFVVRDDSGRINIQPASAAHVPASVAAPEEIPVVRPAPRPATASERPAQPAGKGFKPFTFVVAVVWDPERRLRGELLARLSPYGLQLRDRNDKEYHLPVGTRARHMGGNRFMVDLGTRDLTLRIAKRNCKQPKLARHIADFLNRQRATMREQDYLSAGAVRWLALVPLLTVSLFFLPRGGSALGMIVIVGLAMALGLANFMLLRSTRLALGWRLGCTLGWWVLIGAGVMPLTYFVVRHINAHIDPPRLAWRHRAARDGLWQAQLPGEPAFDRKPSRGIAPGNLFQVATVQLPWDRGKFEIWHSDPLPDFQFGAGHETVMFQQAVQEVHINDGSMHPTGGEREVKLLNKYPGKEFSFQNHSGVNVKMRVYIVKPQAFVMRVTWRGSLAPHDVDNFLNSLTVTPPLAVNPGLPQDNRGPPQWLPLVPNLEQIPKSPQDVGNLLVHWRFDEAEGQLIRDSSGRGQDGRLIGCWRINGIAGQALMFDGVQDHVDFSNVHQLNFAHKAPWTIAGWVAVQQFNTGVILSMRSNWDASMIDIAVENGLLAAKLRSDGNFNAPLQLRGKKFISDSTWHHMALVRYPDGSIRLFQDGEGVANVGAQFTWVANGSITTNVRALGCERGLAMKGQVQGNPVYFSGCVDEFCIFDRALAIREIKALAGRGPARR